MCRFDACSAALITARTAFVVPITISTLSSLIVVVHERVAQGTLPPEVAAEGLVPQEGEHHAQALSVRERGAGHTPAVRAVQREHAPR
jgi:hypothetical protein